MKFNFTVRFWNSMGGVGNRTFRDLNREEVAKKFNQWIKAEHVLTIEIRTATA